MTTDRSEPEPIGFAGMPGMWEAASTWAGYSTEVEHHAIDEHARRFRETLRELIEVEHPAIEEAAA